MSRRVVLRSLAASCAAAVLPAIRANEPEVIRVGGGEIEVTIASASFDRSRNELLTWVTQSAKAVAAYYGRFPVARARLSINARSDRGGVSGGRTWGERGAHTRITVGQNATVADLKRDWMLTHEFVHYGFPDVPEQNHWIEEGIATYVEPLARVSIGTFDASTAWFEMVRDMPQGEPRPGDAGLDNTHTWGRTYWGGAMFCLMADVKIRKATGNRKGLREALRAINQAGGTIETGWTLEHALATGDKATGGDTLMSLYEEMKSKPVPVDLGALWKQLGIARQGDEVVFDDRAPLASIRKAICGSTLRAG